jgi:molybdopterin-binding protein
MDLLNYPSDLTVARILRLDNIFSAVSDGKGTISVGSTKLKAAGIPEGEQTLIVRPWKMTFHKHGEINGSNVISGRVAEIMSDGFSSRLRLDGALSVVGNITNEAISQLGITEGSEITVVINDGAFHCIAGGFESLSHR